MGIIKTKLLHKTLRIYILFSIAALIVSAPLFYFISERLYQEDANEILLLNKQKFVKYSLPKMKTSDIEIFNKINQDVSVETTKIILTKDSIFEKIYFDSLTSENEPCRTLISPIVLENNPYILIIRTNLIETEDLITNIVILFCIIISLLLIGLYIITKWLSIKLWDPFYAILNQIELFDIDKNNFSELNESNIEEFDRLNRSINSLIKRNMSIYQSQHEFIENAAHELQTPLAVFQTKVELLMQRIDITQGQFEILDKLNEATLRLNRLNKNLLLLSKIDNSHYTTTEIFSLKSVIDKQLDFFYEQAEEKNISINVNINAQCLIKANITLIEILISNLFINAIKHNRPQGEINILFQKETLSISNSGKNQSLDNKKLFQRFSKHDPSTRGSGLGLAIVKKIADLYNWQLKYSYHDDLHTFTLQFSEF
jgi:two-component system sensor histidine kinase ArlS